MKRFILLIAFILCTIPPGILGQSCLPDGTYLFTQSEIDNFKADYPDCTEIEGSVEINGYGITNLDSLHMITSVGGYLEIYGVPDLISIEGLGSLSTIGSGRLAIAGSGLTNLHGLENLVSVPGLRIEANPLLTSLDGLNALTSTVGGLYIVENPVLTDLSALENLTYAGQGGTIFIDQNDALTSLAGLDNIVFDPMYVIDIWIGNNPLLSECEVAGICNFLSDNGVIYLSENATGCNTIAEVKEACGLSVDEMHLSIDMQINPNPCSSSANFSYFLAEPSHVSLCIYGPLGQEVEMLLSEDQAQGEHKLQWNTSQLPAGIYTYYFKSGKFITTGKVVVLR